MDRHVVMDACDILPVEPPQPATWGFIEQLKAPLWTDHAWGVASCPPGHVSLADGLWLHDAMADPDGLLETLWQDWRDFLHVGGVTLHEGSAARPDGLSAMRVGHDHAMQPQQHRIAVSADGGVVITAGDVEGVRHAVFHLQDLMRSAQGPFLPVGVIDRQPVVRTRISRCFFGPINRPPMNRDELADDEDYYPEQYLNRLAHDGVNALWLSVKLRDLCPSPFFPEFGQDAPRRQAKLRRTVERCRRYGIRIYAFGIEPMGFGDSPYLIPTALADRHPEMAGHRSPGYINFCPSSQAGQAYIEQAMHTLFSAVPGLGGFVSIQLGERPTHCCSAIHQLSVNNCPRCASRQPGEVFADLWQAMRRGIDRADPSAELISWLYIPVMEDTPDSTVAQKHEAVRRIASHVPRGVTLQMNFESGAIVEQAGQTHPLEDYSLAFIGHSELFEQCAARVTDGGARMAAKIQVGNSHEVATTPCVPVPGNLHAKYRDMHAMGVSTVMQCWYFGNYPSVMTKAAGLLSFSPLPDSEEAFLTQLAAIDWGRAQAPRVVTAWQHFQAAYRQFPVNCRYAWFGPTHDSVAWPLHLVPVDRPVAPSWQLGHAPTGDRVGQCFGYEYTFEQIVAAARAMADRWQQGLDVLAAVTPPTDQARLELSNAMALGLQFHSAANVMAFYHLRQQLLNQPQDGQRATLDRLRQLVEHEIDLTGRLIPLAERDPRLGFHSEAEGYKYHPEKLRWRQGLLERLLATEFPDVSQAIEQGRPLFPHYTGQAPGGLVQPCAMSAATRQAILGSDGPWGDAPLAVCLPIDPQAGLDAAAWRTVWQALRDDDTLYLRATCDSPADAAGDAAHHHLLTHSEQVVVQVEARRVGPTHDFHVTPQGVTHYQGRRSGPAKPWQAEVRRMPGRWQATLAIPLACLAAGEALRWPWRINVRRVIPLQAGHAWSWAAIPAMPTPGYSVHHPHPQAYGWLTAAQLA